MKEYIHYKCKKCEKEFKILKQWGDLKPKRCNGNKGRCKTSFIKNPEMLDIKLPKKHEKKSKKSFKKCIGTEWIGTILELFWNGTE